MALLSSRLAKGGPAIARYRSYLVRVWISAGSDGPQWAGRVECVQGEQEHRRFNDLEALLSYLRSAMEGGPRDPDGTAPSQPVPNVHGSS